MQALPFDTVVIDRGPEQRRVSAAAFMEFPLSERIQLILGRRVEFFSGELGVDRSLALKSLMDSARSTGDK
jgi:hypothetical protein